MNFFKKALNFKQNLFKINNEEITKGTKFLLILYISIMFFIIGGFVSNQRDNIVAPYQKYPSGCLNIIEKHHISFEDMNNYYYIKKMGQECQEIMTHIDTLKKVPLVQQFVKNSNDFEKHSNTLKNKQHELERIYPQILAEKAAGLEKNHSILIANWDDVKINYDTIQKELKENTIKKQENRKNFEALQEYQKIIQLLPSKHHVIEDAKKYEYWYAFYLFLSAGAFLSLIIAISYGIRKKLLQNNVIISQLFYYIYLISMFYFIIYFIDFVLDIMPKYFFKKIIEILATYNLMFLFQYFSIGLIILFFAFLIRRMQHQKKEVSLFDRKSMIFFLSSDKCYICQTKIQGKYCLFCGTQVRKTCEHCQNEIPFLSKFCSKCGTSFLDEKKI